MTNEIMTRGELAELLKVSERVLKTYSKEGTGPKFSKLGHFVRYRREDVEAWITANSKKRNWE